MSNAPEAVVRPITYAVSCLPDSPEAHLWTIEVAYRGRDLWAVTRLGDCLSASGGWEYEVRPSSRTDEWIAEHRFPLDQALELAKAAAPKIRVNQWTVAAAMKREAKR